MEQIKDVKVVMEKIERIELIAEFKKLAIAQNIIKPLFEAAEKEWDNAFNEQTGSHLIKGVLSSGTKTDAINILATSVVVAYCNSVGFFGIGRGKEELLEGKLFYNLALNSVVSKRYQEANEITRAVMAEILGINKYFTNYGLGGSLKSRSEAACSYLASYFNLPINETAVHTDKIVGFLKAKPDVHSQILFIEELADAFINTPADGLNIVDKFVNTLTEVLAG